MPSIVNLSMGGCAVIFAVALGAAAASSPSLASQDAKASWTVQDVMDQRVDPLADALWGSVGTIETQTGVEHRGPKSVSEWTKVEANARALVEGASLLKTPRTVGANGGKGLADARTPGIRTARQIEAEIRSNPARFYAAAERLRRGAEQALDASRARDPQALLNAGAAIDAACEACHAQYWYPRQRLTLPDKTAFAAHVWRGGL